MGMARLELASTGLKNLSRDRFAFIPVIKDQFGRRDSNSQQPGFKPDASAVAPLPQSKHCRRALCRLVPCLSTWVVGVRGDLCAFAHNNHDETVCLKPPA